LTHLPQFIVSEYEKVTQQQGFTEGLVVMLRDSASVNVKSSICISSEYAAHRRARECEFTVRLTCGRCARPLSVCVCSALPERPLETSTRVLILQHPGERKRKTVSTVPLLPLSLANIEIKVGYDFDSKTFEPICDAIRDGLQIVLLYPGPKALPLDNQDKSGDRVDTREMLLSGSNGILLVLIDGTWSEVKRVIRDSPGLVDISTQVSFSGPSRPMYEGVRREPKQHCISTLEACARALRLLERDPASGETAAHHLEASMRKMVSMQLERTPAARIRDGQ